MNALKILALTGICICSSLSPCPASVPAGTDYTSLNKAGDREAAYRDRLFHAYYPRETVSRNLKVSGYSNFENATGIYFAEGETAVIDVEGETRLPLVLRTANFNKGGEPAQYPLKPGRNIIPIEKAGLAYIDYRDENPRQAPPVRIKIQGGHLNGIFTRADDAATWKQLLSQARGNILDIVGERVQLAYNVDGLLEGCPDRGPELIALYDRIIELEQEILGWDQYQCHPGNHIFGRVQWRGFMHADGLGAAYVSYTIPGITDIEKLRASSWGVAHEFGHVNQTRPGMMWVGTQEITNNICAAWVNYNLYPERLRLEHEVTPGVGGETLLGGRFDCYVNNAIVNRQLWQFLGGPDSGIGQAPTTRSGDHFVNVCPFWQLQLYAAVVRGDRNFYARIYEKVRKEDDRETPHGQLRVNFVKNACESAGLDLTDFFVNIGFLAPMNRYVQDYGSRHMTITPDMCREAIAFAARFPKPDTSVLYYLTGNSAPIFKSKAPIVPTPDFKPEIKGDRMTIPPEAWKNAVAFEAYQGQKLARISLLGLNHRDRRTTDVIIPPGTTAVKAVQWDGKRFDVWNKK